MTDIHLTAVSTILIQNAINSIAVGGGNVYLPSGLFDFIINPNNIGLDNYPVGIQIPGGVNLLSEGLTTLNVPLSGWQSSGGASGTYYEPGMVILDGRNNKPIRVSGIDFEGSVYTGSGADDDFHSLSAIKEIDVRDYRIDNCKFNNFTGAAINTGSRRFNPYGNCGVIDHCYFDDIYKDTFYQLTGNHAIWGYGIIFGGWNYTCGGGFPPASQFLGKYGPEMTFVEDCTFRRNRHAIAGAGSGSAGWAVVRHNYFTDLISCYLGSFIDNHGGGRGYEVYSNTIVDVLSDTRSFNTGDPDIGRYWARGINPRGGAGVIFDNTFINCLTPITLSNDQNVCADWRLNEFWINDDPANPLGANKYTNTGTTQAQINANAYPITLNTEYHLNQLPSGYTPYTYPHPLVSGIQLPRFSLDANIVAHFSLNKLS